MTDNTKLKPCLRYCPILGCVIGSILSNSNTKINTYGDIPNIINKIKEKNAVAKDVWAYILQVSQNFNKFYYGHLQWHATWVLIKQINIRISLFMFIHYYLL